VALDIHRVYGVLLRGFRRRRMRRFLALFAPGAETAILDVGGTPFNWSLVATPARVTLLNPAPPRPEAPLPPGLESVRGSGTALGYADASFDVVFSNSVIEHLGSLEAQRAFARELRRVGRGLFVQTPAKSFPFEPHLLAPLVHFLPRRWQRWLIRWCTPWGWIARPSQAAVDRFLSETRLLSRRELAELFPDCEIQRERFLGLARSYVAVRRA
jgi:hypothetical protein